MTSDAPIVLLHGVGLDSAMWAPLISRLARPALTLDLPGHGTRRPLRVRADLTAFADDVLARMPDSPVHLVGFSLGGLIAQRIALSAPDRLLTLTCVSAVAQRTSVERAEVLARLESARADFGATVDRSLLRWFPPGSGVDPATVEETRRTLEANDAASFVQAYEVFAVGDDELGSELGGITVPTLAVTGELDPGSTPEMTHRITAAVPGARGRIVPGVRHMLPVEAPDALATEIHQFIDDAERRD